MCGFEMMYCNLEVYIHSSVLKTMKEAWELAARKKHI